MYLLSIRKMNYNKKFMKGFKKGNSEILYIAAVLAVVIVGILIITSVLKKCEKEDINTSFLKVELFVSPDKGIEPLLVQISISVESSDEIKFVKIDFDGDGKFDLERRPGGKKYSESLNFEYVIPEEDEGREKSTFPTLLTEFYYPITLCVLAENKTQREEKCKTLNIIPAGKPKFNLVASTCSGNPPLEVKLKVELIDKTYDRYTIKWDCDGDGKFEKVGEELETVCRFDVSGLYPTKVSVSAPNKKYTISKYMYCGKVSPGLISKYIEVLPEKVIPHKMFSLPSFKFFDYEVKQGKKEGKYKVLMFFGGNPGFLVLKDNKILDILGVFFSPIVATEVTKDIQQSRITTFPFNVLFIKAWGGKIFITSDSGTYVAEIHERNKRINNIKKITNSQMVIFPFPISETKVFFAIDILTGGIMKCEDEELKFCSILNELSEQKIVRKIKHRYRSQKELSLLVIYSDGSSEIISFNGKNIKKEKIPFEVSEEDIVKVGESRLYIISGNASPEVSVYDILSKKTEKIKQPDERVLFTSVHEILEDKALLGMVEIPCPNSEILESCNISLYDINEDEFFFFEGNGNISDFLFDVRITGDGFSLSSKNIYILKSLGAVEKIRAEYSKSTFYLSQPTHVTSIPLPVIRDMSTGTTEIYVITPKVLISFSSSGYYLGSFSIKEGFIDKMAKSGEYIFLGISDDISTSRKGEGKLIVLDKFREVLKYDTDDISKSVFSCMYAVSENNDNGDIGTNKKQNILIFTCVGNKLKVLEFDTNEKQIIQRCEAELNSQGIDIQYFKNIFVATPDKLFTFDKECNQISSQNSLAQFFQLDIDRERKILFSAEGDNHSFRLWNIQGGYPREITRFSLDLGVEGDIAGGIAHMENTLYVASTHTSLLIFDIKNPQNPKLLRKVWITENFGSLLKCKSIRSENEIACMSPGASILFFR